MALFELGPHVGRFVFFFGVEMMMRVEGEIVAWRRSRGGILRGGYCLVYQHYCAI
jgi:hypothetical protein